MSRNATYRTAPETGKLPPFTISYRFAKMQCMIAHLVTSDLATASDWIGEYATTHQIPAQFRYMIQPAEKELSISQVRDLQRETAYRVPQGRLFVVDRFDTASEEAQNAMLKMLEQPQESDHFILLCTNEQSAIPTIRSRVRIVRLKTPNDHTQAKSSITENDLTGWRTISAEEDARAYIDDAIAYERGRAPQEWNTAHLRRLLSLRQMLSNHVTPQSVADSVTMLYRQ